MIFIIENITIEREAIQLIRQIIERYDLDKNLDMKDKIYLVSPNFIEEKIKKFLEHLLVMVSVI